MAPLFSRQDLEDAASLVHRQMPPTPQYAWPLLARRAGCTVWLKHENHTPTGAFKVRGGIVYVDDLARAAPDAHLVTATRGNHGQSLPFAARPHGIAVTVYAPIGNSAEKNRAMEAWGAHLILHGKDFDSARQEAERVAAADSAHLVPSFHPLLVRGVATYALELFTGVPDLDVVYVPIGMGSGISGLITVRDLLGLKTEIVGVVSSAADAYARSLEEGRVVTTESASTFADGMACRVPDEAALEVVRAGAARVLRVTDDEVAAAVRAIYEDTHNVAEGAGAAAFAGLMQERDRLAGRQAAAILCGGNIDADWFAAILRGETPHPR
ncbi:MAG: threonine dehydratase [Pseudomonadota bacterium]